MTVTFLRTKQKLKFKAASDGSISRTYTLKYLAASDSITELSVLDCLSALGLQAGAPFAQDGNATLEDCEVDRLDTVPPHCAWDVTLTYSTQAKAPQSDTQDPTQWRTKRSKRYRELPRSIIRDKNDKLIVNAAGDPPSGGVPITDYPWIFVYEWNRNVPTSDTFHASINLAKFNNCDPFTLLCLIHSEEVYEGAFHYWKETIEMHYDALGWKPKPVNAGLYQLKSGSKVPCRDDQNQPAAEPQPLHDGTFGAVGLMVATVDRPDKCGFVTVDHYKTSDFTKIGVQQFP